MTLSFTKRRLYPIRKSYTEELSVALSVSIVLLAIAFIPYAYRLVQSVQSVQALGSAL